MEDVRHVAVDGGGKPHGSLGEMYLEDHRRTCKWLVTSINKPLVEAVWKGNNPT